MLGLEARGFIESLVPFLLEFRAPLSDDKCENVAPSVNNKAAADASQNNLPTRR